MTNIPYHFNRNDLPLNNKMKLFWDDNGFLIIDNFYLENECDELINRAKYLVQNFDSNSNRSVFNTNKQKKVKDDYYYNILEVNTDTNEKEIKKKYYKLAMKYHPDRNNNDCDKFKKINEAYQILGNEKMREEYDKYGMETVDKKRIIPLGDI